MSDNIEQKQKRKRGRPLGSYILRITPQVVEAIAEGVKLGMKYKDAAILAGVKPRTFENWMAKAKKGNGKYFELMDALDKAVEHAKKVHLGYINKHAAGGFKSIKTTTKYNAEGKVIEKTECVETLLPNLKASTWILERRHPKEFGPRQEVAIGNGDNPFEVSLFGQAVMGSAQVDLFTQDSEPQGDE